MKKFSYIILVFLLTISFTFAFAGCVSENDGSAQVYGDVLSCYSMENIWGLTKTSLEYTDELYGEYNSFQHTIHYPCQRDEHISICDGSELTGDITFVTDEPQAYSCSVITTKWWYYSSRLQGNHYLDQEFCEKIINDEYCMEKVVLDWFSVVVDDKSSPYYDMTWREMSKSLEDEHENCLNAVSSTGKYMWYPDVSESDPDTWGIVRIYYPILRTAALARYSSLDTSALSGVGTLLVSLPYEKTLNGATVTDYKQITLNIVGYVETEADKLLSTGVSMDKNSDEYKIVMEQLKNPVFYSICGNFLDEVEK